MRRSLLTGIAVAAVLAAVVTAAAALYLQQPGTLTAPVAGPTTADSSPAPAPPAAGTPSAPLPSAEPAPTKGPPPSAVPAPRRSADEGEAELVPPGAVPGTLPGSKPLAALVSLPLPDTSSAVGSIVSGFPTRVIPEAPNSSIATSSVAAEGSRLQAALTAQTTLTVVEVMDFYRTALAKLALFDAPAPSLDGSSALAFSRGANTVTLTATTIDGGCRYVIFGSFSAAS